VAARDDLQAALLAFIQDEKAGLSKLEAQQAAAVQLTDAVDDYVQAVLSAGSAPTIRAAWPFPSYIAANDSNIVADDAIHLFGLPIAGELPLSCFAAQHITNGGQGGLVGMGLYTVDGALVARTDGISVGGWTGYSVHELPVHGAPVTIAPGFYLLAHTATNGYIHWRATTTPATGMHRYWCHTSTRSAAGVLPANIALPLIADNNYFPFIELRAA
jgi:hypothetical protein